MRRFATFVSGLMCLALPSLVYAQASITGVVRDASGAILPGVTVEASSPALIEKVRSVVTDGTGQYRIVDLRPGLYAVAFSLPGFSTVRREGIELEGEFVATVNADLRVGALQETITVTGESPLVDVQSSRTTQTMDKELISSIPSGRQYWSLTALVPALNIQGSDVGGIRYSVRDGETGFLVPPRDPDALARGGEIRRLDDAAAVQVQVGEEADGLAGAGSEGEEGAGLAVEPVRRERRGGRPLVPLGHRQDRRSVGRCRRLGVDLAHAGPVPERAHERVVAVHEDDVEGRAPAREHHDFLQRAGLGGGLRAHGGAGAEPRRGEPCRRNDGHC